MRRGTNIRRNNYAYLELARPYMRWRVVNEASREVALHAAYQIVVFGVSALSTKAANERMLRHKVEE